MAHVAVGVVAALAIIVGTAMATTLFNNPTSGSQAAGQPSSYSSSPWQGAPRGSARMPGWAWLYGGTLRNEAKYLTEMIAHHQEAVTAATQLQRSDRPQIRAFGAPIVKTQCAQTVR